MKKSKRLVGILIILLCAVIAILSYLLWKRPTERPETVNGGVMIEPIGGEVRDDLPGVVIPGWGAMKLPARETEVETPLYNPKENKGYYDLSFTLTLDETGEEVFTTGKVAPGYQCSMVTLNRTLEAGEYKATLLVQPYLQNDSDTLINRANVSLKLIVK